MTIEDFMNINALQENGCFLKAAGCVFKPISGQ